MEEKPNFWMWLLSVFMVAGIFVMGGYAIAAIWDPNSIIAPAVIQPRALFAIQVALSCFFLAITGFVVVVIYHMFCKNGKRAGLRTLRSRRNP